MQGDTHRARQKAATKATDDQLEGFCAALCALIATHQATAQSRPTLPAGAAAWRTPPRAPRASFPPTPSPPSLPSWNW